MMWMWMALVRAEEAAIVPVTEAKTSGDICGCGGDNICAARVEPFGELADGMEWCCGEDGWRQARSCVEGAESDRAIAASSGLSRSAVRRLRFADGGTAGRAAWDLRRMERLRGMRYASRTGRRRK